MIISLSFILAVFILILGGNFLKGINLLQLSNHYYVQYKTLDGLVVSNPVNVLGYKVGLVKEINYDFTQEKPFIVHFEVNDDILIPIDSKANLEEDGIMGNKVIALHYGKSKQFFHSGDTIDSDDFFGYRDEFDTIIMPILEAVNKLDSSLILINNMLRNGQMENTLTHLNHLSRSLESSSQQLNSMLSNDVPVLMTNFKTISGHLASTSEKLDSIDLVGLSNYAHETLIHMDQFTQRLNDSTSTLGLLTTQNKLYLNLDSTVQSANTLLIDLKAHPKRYVKFSLW